MARLMIDRDKLIKAFYLQCLLPEGGFFERDDFSYSRIKEIILTAVPAEIVKEQSDKEEQKD